MGSGAGRVASTVLATFVAGLVFCRLRASASSLLAPVVLHRALNSVGVVLVQLVSLR